MSILDNLKGLFSRRQTLADIKEDDLRRARVQLEREQDRVLRQIDEIEKKKSRLDAQGRAERSVRKQKLLAQQILGLEAQAKHFDRNLSFYAKQLRIVDGFLFLKENERVLANTPLGEIISRMTTAELQGWVDQATVDGSVQLDKLNQLLGVFEEDEALFREEEDDRAVADLVAGWQAAQESEGLVPDLGDWEEAQGEL